MTGEEMRSDLVKQYLKNILGKDTKAIGLTLQ
jgi:hypothetical protein